MVSEEQEYPELHRKIRLVPTDPRVATDPLVCRYLDVLADELQPIVTEAMKEIIQDVLAYGTPRRPIESYVGDLIERDRLRRELKQRVALWTKLGVPE